MRTEIQGMPESLVAEAKKTEMRNKLFSVKLLQGIPCEEMTKHLRFSSLEKEQGGKIAGLKNDKLCRKNG